MGRLGYDDALARYVRRQKQNAKIFANEGLHHVRYEKLTEPSPSLTSKSTEFWRLSLEASSPAKSHAKIAETAQADTLANTQWTTPTLMSAWK